MSHTAQGRMRASQTGQPLTRPATKVTSVTDDQRPQWVTRTGSVLLLGLIVSELIGRRGTATVRTTVIRTAAAAVLLSAAALTVAGCSTSLQEPANPNDTTTTSYGPAVTTTAVAPSTAARTQTTQTTQTSGASSTGTSSTGTSGADTTTTTTTGTGT